MLVGPVVALVRFAGLLVVAEEILIDLAVYEILERLEILQISRRYLHGLVEIVGIPVDQIYYGVRNR